MLGSSKKILIVDDDIMILAALRRLLGQEYCLAEANSGEEALAVLDNFAADLVMLDIMLPGIDGYETCRRIRASLAGGRSKCSWSRHDHRAVSRCGPMRRGPTTTW